MSPGWSWGPGGPGANISYKKRSRHPQQLLDVLNLLMKVLKLDFEGSGKSIKSPLHSPFAVLSGYQDE